MARISRRGHAALLDALIEDPSAKDEELSQCIPGSTLQSAKKHINWARNHLRQCICIYEATNKMDQAKATECAIAKNPNISDEDLVHVVRERLGEGVRHEQIADDYGPQTRMRFERIALLNAEERKRILRGLP